MKLRKVALRNLKSNFNYFKEIKCLSQSKGSNQNLLSDLLETGKKHPKPFFPTCITASNFNNTQVVVFGKPLKFFFAFHFHIKYFSKKKVWKVRKTEKSWGKNETRNFYANETGNIFLSNKMDLKKIVRKILVIGVMRHINKVSV